MAEGWARNLLSESVEPFSAGTVKHGLNPLAVQVMSEAGVDISHHSSKTLEDISDHKFDLVITVCSDADRNCPIFPGNTRKLHHAFDDPPKMAEALTSEEDRLACYRRVSDEIRQFVKTIPDILAQGGDL